MRFKDSQYENNPPLTALEKILRDIRETSQWNLKTTSYNVKEDPANIPFTKELMKSSCAIIIIWNKFLIQNQKGGEKMPNKAKKSVQMSVSLDKYDMLVLEAEKKDLSVSTYCKSTIFELLNENLKD